MQQVGRKRMIPRNIVASWLGLIVATLGSASILAAQTAAPPGLPSAIDLVRATVSNEAHASDSKIKHMFCDRKKTAQGSETHLFVETREGVAGMTIANDGNPVTSEQLHSEEERLKGLVENSDQLRRKQQKQKEDSDRSLSIVTAFPEAFRFKYDGTEEGTASLGRPGAHLVRLKFWPNPSYHPPSHVQDVLVGMSGFLVIDPKEHRIARIDGTLFREVSFGWGILGHLDKGGHFFVEQADVGEDSWEVTRMRLEFTGKILLFKNLSIKSDELFSNFQRVPSNTTFAQGVRLLEAQEAKLAETGEIARISKSQ